ncbi:hypothetical protein I350_07952 [Cryptococcus amylolentus CBS 6273]|uniref:SET domain-containing protein n=1 Tax=Cryptococcus amylolentus CBS 6273 TaxID=1296118 RepID=A0A1E3JA29_9TREE|nr:hypothetical protein I350_07952 [Cryptococcus amylolentus CBS 6273]
MIAESKEQVTGRDVGGIGGAWEDVDVEEERVAVHAPSARQQNNDNTPSDHGSSSPTTPIIAPVDKSPTNSDISFRLLVTPPTLSDGDSLTSQGDFQKGAEKQDDEHGPGAFGETHDGEARTGEERKASVAGEMKGSGTSKEEGEQQAELESIQQSMKKLGFQVEPSEPKDVDETSTGNAVESQLSPSHSIVATNYTYDTPQESWLYTKTDPTLPTFRERFLAKRHIFKGRVIMWERPLILYDCQNAADRFFHFHSQLSQGSKDKIEALPNNYPKLGEYGRWFGNSVLCDKPIKGRMFGVFESIMRVPRSCEPNAHFVWDEECCAGYIIAAEDIPRDGEIFIRWDPLYVYDQSPTRHVALKDVGHICTCPKCSMAPTDLTKDDNLLDRYYNLTRASQTNHLTKEAALTNFTCLHEAHLLAIFQALPTEQEKLIGNMILCCVKCADLESAQRWLALQRDVVLVLKGEALGKHGDLDRAVKGGMLKKDPQWGTLGEIKLSGPRDEARQASAELLFRNDS